MQIKVHRDWVRHAESKLTTQKIGGGGVEDPPGAPSPPLPYRSKYSNLLSFRV